MRRPPGPGGGADARGGVRTLWYFLQPGQIHVGGRADEPVHERGGAERRLVEQGWQGTKLSPYDQHYYRAWTHELPPLVHVEREVEADLQDDTRPLASLDQASRAGNIDGQRFFTQHMLPVTGGRNNTFLMEAVGRGHDDRVKTGCLKHPFQVVEGFAAEVGADRFRAFQVSVEDGNELCTVASVDGWRMAETHDGPGADETNPDLG